MRFHYWKQFVAVLILTFLIWWGFLLFALNPLTLARSQNREITTYLNQTSSLLEKALSMEAAPQKSPELAPRNTTLKEAKDMVSAALVVTSDQGRTLSVIAESKSGLEAKDLVAFFVAIAGGISTIILSWRKDIREARA